jgi:hypothetical protein
MRCGALGTNGEYEACSNQCNQRDYEEALHGVSLRLILKVRLKIVARYGVVVRCFSRRRVHWKSKDC